MVLGRFMNIIDVCRLKYPGEIEKGNIIFSASSGEFPFLILTWNVPNTTKPTEASLTAEIPAYQAQYDAAVAEQQRQMIIAKELPPDSERLDALWELALTQDNTKLNQVEAARQAVFAAHPAPE